MPCSRPQSTRQEEEGRGAEVGRIVSASEEEGREAKIREKIQPRYRWPAVSSLDRGAVAPFVKLRVQTTERMELPMYVSP